MRTGPGKNSRRSAEQKATSASAGWPPGGEPARAHAAAPAATLPDHKRTLRSRITVATLLLDPYWTFLPEYS